MCSLSTSLNLISHYYILPAAIDLEMPSPTKFTMDNMVKHTLAHGKTKTGDIDLTLVPPLDMSQSPPKRVHCTMHARAEFTLLAQAEKRRKVVKRLHSTMHIHNETEKNTCSNPTPLPPFLSFFLPFPALLSLVPISARALRYLPFLPTSVSPIPLPTISAFGYRPHRLDTEVPCDI
jgi:hypothetical protein